MTGLRGFTRSTAGGIGGVVEIQVDTSEGPYDLGVWRFDKLFVTLNGG